MTSPIYYIVNLEDGTVHWTDSAELAKPFTGSNEYAVIDTISKVVVVEGFVEAIKEYL